VNRKDFQSVALVRLREAAALLAAELPDGAYYLSGYAVECALKACIARQTQRHDFPPDLRTVQSIYTHDLVQLVTKARLADALDAEMRADHLFADRWRVAKDWSEASRYERIVLPEAQRMYLAVSDRRHGVLRWIKQFW
jgi:hypothetical protein